MKKYTLDYKGIAKDIYSIINSDDVYEDNRPFAVCDGCTHLGIDGGPSAVMCCNHYNAPIPSYIVEWDSERKNRTSYSCPKEVDYV